MRLPRRWLTCTGQVLKQVKGPADKLGQSVLMWVADGPDFPCASYPAGKKVLELAQLKGVKVAREVYAERLDLNPQTNRLRIDGVDYQITLVNDWERDFAVVGVVSA